MINTLNLFVKYLPTNNPISNEEQRELTRKSFKKEEFFYNIFISTFNKLSFEDITNFAPKLYLVIKDEALVFEDLSEIGYRISDIRQTANIEWLYSCIKSLAKLHACSILFEEKMSSLKEKMYRIDEEYEKNLVETLMIKDSLLYGNSGRTVVNGIIDKFPDVPKRFSVEEFKRKAKQKFDSECEMVTKSTKYRNVICHGDLWASNIMIKEDPNTLTTSNFLIDFQLIKYCPPAFDLLQVIYTHTSKEMRADYLNYLLRVYYENLTEILRRYGVDVTEILDKKAFMSCCKDMKSAAICSALNFVQVFVPEDRYTYLKSTDQEKKTEFLVGDRIKFLEEVLQEEPLKTRIRDLLVDLYNECLDEDQ